MDTGETNGVDAIRESAAPVGAEDAGAFLDATDFLRELWYFAGLGKDLLKGDLVRKILLREPVLIGRSKTGEVFALRDICPHRGMPLSNGKMTRENTIQCCYHGWRFTTKGVCTEIPSLTEDDRRDLSATRVQTYPAIEQDGLIWIFMPDFPTNHIRAGVSGVVEPAPKFPPPSIGIRDAKPRWVESQTFHCGVDHAVVGLMDPAHAHYVHKHWWWGWWGRPKEKIKQYESREMGFAMSKHKPTKGLYRFFLGLKVSTEIIFMLPGLRFENISGALFGLFRMEFAGFTACTPIDSKTTQVTQIFYYRPSWFNLPKLFFIAFGKTFLTDDRMAVEKQRAGLEFEPKLIPMPDADVPAMWYQQIKKAWAKSVHERKPFKNRVKTRELRWRS